MRTEPSRTFIGTVVCLDLVGYSLKPVAQQGAVKAAFNRLLAEAITGIPVEDRIILDTGDGAAITFLGDPESAFQVALTLRERMTAASPVRIGINLGPVRPSVDMNGHTRLIGDGIHGAERIAAFAEPGQVVVSRSFHDMASRLSHEHAAGFEYVGVRADKTGREHEVYAVKAKGAAPPARSGDPDPREMTQAMRTAPPFKAAAPPASAPVPQPVPEPAAATAEPGWIAFLRDGGKVGMTAAALVAVIAAQAWILTRPTTTTVAEAPNQAVPGDAPKATEPVVPAPAPPPPRAEAAPPKETPKPEPAKEAPKAAPAKIEPPKPDPAKAAVPKPEAPKPGPAKPDPAKDAKAAPPKDVAKPAPPREPPRSAPAKDAPKSAPAKPVEAPKIEPPKVETAPAPVAAKPVEPAPAKPPEPVPAAPTTAVTIVSRAPVAFPIAAAKEGIAGGTVRARLSINAEGRVVNIRVTESDPPRVFDREAVKSLEQWRFNPGAEGRVHEVQLDFKR